MGIQDIEVIFIYPKMLGIVLKDPEFSLSHFFELFILTLLAPCPPPS